MSSAPTPAEIVRDAKWLAQALDPETGLLRVVEMDREAYREASFLDDRLLQTPHSAGVVPWAAIAGPLTGHAGIFQPSACTDLGVVQRSPSRRVV